MIECSKWLLLNISWQLGLIVGAAQPWLTRAVWSVGLMIDEKGQTSAWICDKCKTGLTLSKVKAAYLSGNFEVDLPTCPVCRSVYVGEELALGKMLEVEKTLEDK